MIGNIKLGGNSGSGSFVSMVYPSSNAISPNKAINKDKITMLDLLLFIGGRGGVNFFANSVLCEVVVPLM